MPVDAVQVTVELGRPNPTEAQRIQINSWIGQARYLIGKRLGDITLLDQADVDYVVLQAVAAHARNPLDATQVDVAVDDARVSKRYSTGRGRVTISDDLWGILEGDGAQSSEAFTINPSYAPDLPWWCADAR